MIHECLLTSILREQDLQTLAKVQDKHLTDEMKPVFEYVRKSLAQSKVLPTKQAVEAHFGETYKETADTPEHWMTEVREAYAKEVVERATRELARNPKQGMQTMQVALLELQSEGELRSRSYADGAADRLNAYGNTVRTGGIRYIATGDPSFDAHTFGYTQADFWIIGSGEGVGKTWLLLQLAMLADKEVMAQKIDRPVLVINTEVDDEEFVERMDAIRYKLPYGKLISGTLDVLEKKRWAMGVRNMKSNIWVVDDCYNLQDLARYMALLKPAAVFADSVHLLAADYDWKDISNLGTACKKLAKRHQCPIIATTHLKTGEGKDAGSGSVDSFAYGKGFTRNASVAMLLYRDDQMELNDELGIKFVKIRRGNPKAAHFVYNSDFKKMEWTHKYDNGIGASPVVELDDDDDGNAQFKW